MLFYAGHGLQVAGQNYSFPSMRMDAPVALEFEMLRWRRIHRIMERQTNTNILFLDACRDNPLARNLARSMGTRSTEIGKGLAAVEAGVGTSFQLLDPTRQRRTRRGSGATPLLPVRSPSSSPFQMMT